MVAKKLSIESEWRASHGLASDGAARERNRQGLGLDLFETRFPGACVRVSRPVLVVVLAPYYCCGVAGSVGRQSDWLGSTSAMPKKASIASALARPYTHRAGCRTP
jgi:hypothetical protein